MKETTVSNAPLPPLQVELPEALREPTRSKSLLFMILYTVANMVIGVGNITIGSILLAEHVALFAPASQTTIFSLILALGAIVAVVANPLVGMLSDRTTSRWGRRRPWYIAGALGTVLILLMMGQAPSLLVVAIGYIVLQVPINMLVVTLGAIIPDQVPLRQRATISALSAGPGTLLGGLFGQTLVAQFFKGIPAAYTSLAIAIAIMVVPFLLVLREAPLPKEHVPQRQLRHFLTMLRPLARREFALIWVARCLMFLAYNTINAFMFFYLQDVVHYTQTFPGHSTAQGVQAFFGVNVLSIILASLIGGVLSDRLLRRKAFVIAASVIMAAGLLLYAVLPIWSMVLVGTAIMATGFGIYLGVDFALASRRRSRQGRGPVPVGHLPAHGALSSRRRHYSESFAQLPGALRAASHRDLTRCCSHHSHQERALGSPLAEHIGNIIFHCEEEGGHTCWLVLLSHTPMHSKTLLRERALRAL